MIVKQEFSRSWQTSEKPIDYASENNTSCREKEKERNTHEYIRMHLSMRRKQKKM